MRTWHDRNKRKTNKTWGVEVLNNKEKKRKKRIYWSVIKTKNFKVFLC